MRLLADENFPKPVVEALRAGGHDVLWARTDLAGASEVALLDLAESDTHRADARQGLLADCSSAPQPTWRNPGSFCFEFMQRLPRDSRRLWMLSPRRTPRGPDLSASLRSTEFRWSRRAESEAPLRCCFLQLAHRRDLCAGEICPRLRVVNQTGLLPKTS